MCVLFWIVRKGVPSRTASVMRGLRQHESWQ